MSDMGKISVRIDDDLLRQLRQKAGEHRDLSDSLREAIRAYVNPASSVATDPVLQAMANGLRRESESRQLPVETIVHLWFQMMAPALPKLDADSLRTNIEADPEPEGPKS